MVEDKDIASENTEENARNSIGENGMRDKAGKFLKGHKGLPGAGNPYWAQVHQYREEFRRGLKEGDITSVAKMVSQKAKDGEPWAVRELFDRSMGKPQQTIDMTVSGPTIDEIVADYNSAAIDEGGGAEE